MAMGSTTDVFWATRTARTILNAQADGSLTARYGLVERAFPAALPALPRTRLAVQTNYLTDLGVRGMTEAAAFLDGHLRIQDLSAHADDSIPPTKPSEWATRWVDGHYRESDFCALVDAHVCFAGDWAMARELTSAVLSVAKPLTTHVSLLYAAAAMASDADSVFDAEELFGRAAKATPTDVDSMLAELRLAAFVLKRRNEPGRTLRILDELRRRAADAEARYVISPADRMTMWALVANLAALAFIRQGEPRKAFESISEADGLLPRDGWVMVERDAAHRYTSQVKTNLAQMLVKRGDSATALHVLDENIAHNRESHPESLGETLSIAAYFHYRQHSFTQALELIRETYRCVRLEGSPSRLEKCRKIAVATLHTSGESAEAERVIDRMRLDPLGFDEDIMTFPDAR
uniref:Uncharacterized protein n=1 Tax=uncultured bacterium esnapd2 TaxID=1366601 RepID=S5TKB1_9BACT|nr:hypothetical protein [uncultured bacterium esnapd2]